MYYIFFDLSEHNFYIPGEMHFIRSFIVSFVFLSSNVYAVNLPEIRGLDEIKIGSLLQLTSEEAVNDSLLMETYFSLAWEYRFPKPSMALNYTKKALALAEELEYEHITGKALAEIAYLKWRLSRFDEALARLVDAGDILLKYNDISGYARVLNTRGAIYSEKGYSVKALDDFFSALKLLNEIDSIARTGAVLNNIAMIYQWQEDFEMAAKYHLRSLAVKEKYDDEAGIAFSLNNLGVISQNKGEYDEALVFFRQSLEIRQALNDSRGIAAVNRNIGCLYFERKEFGKAKEHYLIARAMYEIAEDVSGIVQVDHFLGRVYLATGELERAKHYFEQSLRLSEHIGLIAFIIENHDALGELMAAKGRFFDAYHFKKKHRELRDSLLDAESRRKIMEMQMMHEWELKENEIELLRKEKQISDLSLERQTLIRNFLLVIILLTAITIIIIYNRFLAYKRTNALLHAQKNEIIDYNTRLKNMNSSLFQEKEKVDDLNEKLRRSEKTLKELNETKDKFFSIISHDLRSPFASIVSFSRIMKRDINNLSMGELQELVLELDKSVLKINSLLDNLLQWSRSQTGKIRYEPSQFRLKEIVSDNMTLFAAYASEKGIEMVDNTDDELNVYGDVNMIDTILRNLISNALKYTDRGGIVTLDSNTINNMVEISVTDTGVGISEDDQKKLFRTNSLHTTFGTRDEKGSGLGLLLCEEFVKKHGGNISLKSELNKGSVFSFTIPIRKPDN